MKQLVCDGLRQSLSYNASNLIPRQHRVSSCCAFELFENFELVFLEEKPGFFGSTDVVPIAGLEGNKVFYNL